MKHPILKKLTLLALLAAVSLFPSCRRAAEKAREKIRIEAVEKVEPHAFTGLDLTLRVKNGTGHALVLRRASLTLWFGGSRVGDVVLREGVEVPRRTTQSVATRWRFAIEDPISLYVLARCVDKGDLSQIGVSYELEGRGGPVPVNISQGEMPLSDFLRIFGLTIEEVKKYLDR